MLQEGRPLPGPKTGLLSNTWKSIVQGDTCADKTDFIGKGARRKTGGWGNPGELLCRVARMARSLGFYGDGISFRVVFSQSF